MSSAATAGPPPSRPPPGNGGGAVGAHRAMNGSKIGNDGASRGSNRVFAHIDDLTAAKPDVNIYSPMRTLLLQCEIHSKQAQTHLDFGRPDLALTEYIKATILLVEIIPRHKDFPQLKSDRGELHRLFGGLQRGLSTQFQKFEGVKIIIKENNAQNRVTSVQRNGHETTPIPVENTSSPTQDPSTKTQVNGFTNANETPQSNGIHSILNGAPTPPSTLPGGSNGQTSYKRPKPPIQPKPDALHGKSILATERPAPPTLSKTEEDIAARFARLRGSDVHSSGVVQDPRIRTQTIGMPATVNIDKGVLSPTTSSFTRPVSYQQRPERPSGPRDMPPSGPLKSPKPPLDLDIPLMPRPPDAIYSPARNFDSPTNIDMPRTTPHGTFGVTSRSSSISSASNVGLSSRSGLGNLNKTPGFDQRQEYFGRAPSLSNDTRSSNALRKGLPDSSTISAEELMEYLRRGSHELPILLADIRPREDFDSGHIMAQNIICIEPMVLRKGISADDLADSMVLSPESELRLFKQREIFDLVVFYDDSSSDLRANLHNFGHETALSNFTKAVYDYGYAKRLKQQPLLLQGGLDAWVDLVGRGALKTSNTATVTPGISRKPYGQLPNNRRAPTGRRATYESRPLTKEEESKWEQTIKNESFQDAGISGSPGVLRDGASEEAYFVRTTEDFVRRFPEASAIPESMISPARVDDQSAHIAAAHIDELNSMTPRIPARPPPALPRPSYTGVSDTTAVYKPMPQAVQMGIPAAANTISRPVGISNHCGLRNYGNTCYLNSALQALSSTMPFAIWLTGYDFLSAARPPRKSGETSDPPQLMAKNLANLFRHLWSGKFSFVAPETLKAYISAVGRRSGRGSSAIGMGGSAQQDAHEFLQFLLDILEDETNMTRDVPIQIQSSHTMEMVSKLSPLAGSVREWNQLSRNILSPLTGMFYHQSMTTTTCTNCPHINRKFEHEKFIFVGIPNGQGSSKLEECLKETYKIETPKDYICDKCGVKGSSTRKAELTIRPEILVIVLNRFSGGDIKSPHVVTFGPELDMTPYFYDDATPASDGSAPPLEIKKYNTPPLKYTCYAVIQHAGSSARSGHYWTIAKDQASKPTNPRDPQWFRFNDQQVEVAKGDFKATQSNQTYIMFYQRRKI